MTWHIWFAIGCVTSTPVTFLLARIVFGDGDGRLYPRPHLTDRFYPLEQAEFDRPTSDGTAPEDWPPDVSWIEFEGGNRWIDRRRK